MALNIGPAGRRHVCWLSVLAAWLFMAAPGWCQTYVSGTAVTTDGLTVTSGAVVLERGELGSNAFRAGGALAADGSFKIPLPSGGLWGLHVYSGKIVSFAIQTRIKEGLDNPVPVLLSADTAPEDELRISNIHFNKISDHVLQVVVEASVSDNGREMQVLAVDTRSFKAYRLLPANEDPQDRYTSPLIPLARNSMDPGAWLVVAAGSGPGGRTAVLTGLGGSIFKPPAAARRPASCEVSGFWKSDAGKLYGFFSEGPGEFRAESYDREMTIDRMTQNGAEVLMDYQFQGRKGTAALELMCRESRVELRGRFDRPNRPGPLAFTKIRDNTINAAPPGAELFAAHCAACHYADRKSTKVGPGLAGLSRRTGLPATGLPVTAENLRLRIINGGRKMPAFKNLTAEQVQALVDYLQGL